MNSDDKDADKRSAGNKGVNRTERWLVVVLLVAAAFPYARTLFYGYIPDDASIIRGNPLVQSWSGVYSAWTHPFWMEQGPSRSGLYRPLVFTIVWNAGHKLPIWFHLFAIAAHTCAAWLVWRLLRGGIGRWTAFAAALW